MRSRKVNEPSLSLSSHKLNEPSSACPHLLFSCNFYVILVVHEGPEPEGVVKANHNTTKINRVMGCHI